MFISDLQLNNCTFLCCLAFHACTSASVSCIEHTNSRKNSLVSLYVVLWLINSETNTWNEWSAVHSFSNKIKWSCYAAFTMNQWLFIIWFFQYMSTELRFSKSHVISLFTSMTNCLKTTNNHQNWNIIANIVINFSAMLIIIYQCFHWWL
jgi:hypothetical protein